MNKQPRYAYATTSGRAGWLETGPLGWVSRHPYEADHPRPPDGRIWELVAVTQGGGVLNWTWRRIVPAKRKVRT